MRIKSWIFHSKIEECYHSIPVHFIPHRTTIAYTYTKKNPFCHKRPHFLYFLAFIFSLLLLLFLSWSQVFPFTFHAIFHYPRSSSRKRMCCKTKQNTFNVIAQIVQKTRKSTTQLRWWDYKPKCTLTKRRSISFVNSGSLSWLCQNKIRKRVSSSFSRRKISEIWRLCGVVENEQPKMHSNCWKSVTLLSIYSFSFHLLTGAFISMATICYYAI